MQRGLPVASAQHLPPLLPQWPPQRQRTPPVASS